MDFNFCLKMFVYLRRIYLSETDATGAFYFAEQFKIALEALESYFHLKGFSLQALIEKEAFLLPIVHAEGNYLFPLRVGDEVRVELSVGEIGTSSFTLHTRLIHGTSLKEVGNTRIVHVAVLKASAAATPLPAKLLEYLKQLIALPTI